MDRWSRKTLRKNIRKEGVWDPFLLPRLCFWVRVACKVVPPGRVFLHRLNDATKGLHLSNDRAQITSSIRADLQVLQTFLASFNGVSFWREELRLEAELQATLDVTGS